MTLLALLRHGETSWSRERRIQGRTDIGLCVEGRKHLAARSLPSEWRAVRVVSSPLLRCVETASALGLVQVQSDVRLVEMSWGQWEGRRLDELRADLGEEMQANESLGLDFTPPGGESPRQVYERARAFLAEVAAEGKPTLAITHRGVIRSIFAYAVGWDMRGRPPARLDWDALHIFNLGDGGTPAASRMNVALPRKATGAAAA